MLVLSTRTVAMRSASRRILTRLGRLDEAREQLSIVAAGGFAGLAFDANWLSALGESAEAIAALSATEAAAPLDDLLVPYAGRPLTAGRAIASYGAADRALGILASFLGRPDGAIAGYGGFEVGDRRRGMRPWVVHARLALARVLSSRDPRRAREVRAEAEAEAAELGLSGLLE